MDARKAEYIRMSQRKFPKCVLHKALKKYGTDAFNWTIIDSTDQEPEAFELEVKYIKEFNSHYIDGFGYNMTDGGEGISGYIYSTESSIQQGKDRQGKTRSRQSITKSNEGISRNWKALSPYNVIFTFRNLAAFCREHNLDDGCMVRISQGLLQSYKGWNCWKLDENMNPISSVHRSGKRKLFSYTDPQGNLVQTTTLRKLCTEHNLNESIMSKVSSGKRKRHRGWTAAILP